MKMYQALWFAGVCVMLTSFIPAWRLHPHVIAGIGLMISGTIHWFYYRS